jgi:hypothetical protein
MPHQNLDVASYPDSVFLDGNPLFMGTNAIFSGVVDGVPLTIRADGFRFDFGLGLSVTRSICASIRGAPVEICWNSRSNKNYQVEYRSAQTTNIWVPLGGPVSGNGGTNCVSDTEGDIIRFYRIRQLP